MGAHFPEQYCLSPAARHRPRGRVRVGVVEREGGGVVAESERVVAGQEYSVVTSIGRTSTTD